MRQEAQNLAREDRPTTLHELGQVIDLLIAMDQLPLTALASLESEDSRSEGNWHRVLDGSRPRSFASSGNRAPYERNPRPPTNVSLNAAQ